MLTNSIRFSFPEPSCKAAVSSAYCRANDSSASAHGASQDGLAFAQDCLIAGSDSEADKENGDENQESKQRAHKGQDFEAGQIS